MGKLFERQIRRLKRHLSNFSSHSIHSRTHFSGPWQRRELKESPIHGPKKRVSPMKVIPLGHVELDKEKVYNNDNYILFFCFHFIYSEELFYGHIGMLVIISEGSAHFLNRLLQANRDNRLEITHFKFLKKLGSGSFGTVFLAKHPGRDELVAVKKVLALRMNEVEAREALRIVIEKEASCHCQGHPNVVQLLDTFTISTGSKKAFYFVYEYADAGDLLDLIFRIHNNIDQDDNCGLFYKNEWEINIEYNHFIMLFTKYLVPQMLMGISTLHERGIIHLDLKPENILINKRGVCKISDMGLVKRFRWFHYSARAEFLTSLQREVPDEPNEDEAYVAGTLPYMEPEMRGAFISTRKNIPADLFDYEVTFSADYFSLGLIFFELMTGFLYGFQKSYSLNRMAMVNDFIFNHSGLPFVAWDAFETIIPAVLLRELYYYSPENLHNFTHGKDEGIVDILLSSCQRRKKRWLKYTIPVKVRRQGKKIEENIIDLHKIQSKIPLFNGLDFESLHFNEMPKEIQRFLFKPEPLYKEYSNSDDILNGKDTGVQMIYKWPYFDFHLPTKEQEYVNLKYFENEEKLVSKDFEKFRDTTLRSVRPHNNQFPPTNEIILNDENIRLKINMFSPKSHIDLITEEYEFYTQNTTNVAIRNFLEESDLNDYY